MSTNAALPEVVLRFGCDKNPKSILFPNFHKTYFNVEELKTIVLYCNLKMVKFAYTVKAPDDTIVLEGELDAPDCGVYEISIPEILPMQKLSELPLDQGNHYVSVDVHIENGRIRRGGWGFAGTLTKASWATEIPEEIAGSLKEKFYAIPLARPDMSIQELRQICVDVVKLNCEFPHKITKEVAYRIPNQRYMPRFLRPDFVHGGFPYVIDGTGNLPRMFEVYDEKTGTIDDSEGFLTRPRLYGNVCSTSLNVAWCHVINSAEFDLTRQMTEMKGFLTVGPYKHSASPEKYTKDGYNCTVVCQENGEQTIFESYAQAHIADAALNHGHIRMFSHEPVVVRNEDGTINGEESYAIMHEQVCYTNNPNHNREFADKTTYVANGFVDIKYTFKELFDTGYIPITFAEFLGQKPVEYRKVSVDFEKDSICAEELKNVTVSSNFPISDMFIIVKDENGNQVYRFAHRALSFKMKVVPLGEVLDFEALSAVDGATLEINCRFFSGEEKIAYRGTWAK